MKPTYAVGSTADEPLLGTERYPMTVTEGEYDALKHSVTVIDALWYFEESYDALLQNAVEFEIAVAQLALSVVRRFEAVWLLPKGRLLIICG
jgi:hypothetical protein